jgi:hypothetical protein
MTEIKKQPDVKPGLTRQEWEKNCEHYAEDAFYTPPERFLFRHYDEVDQKLVCWRPMVGMEKYTVNDINGGFYGVYDTRDVAYYIKSGTWVVIDEPGFFERADVERLERELAEKKELLRGTLRQGIENIRKNAANSNMNLD